MPIIALERHARATISTKENGMPAAPMCGPPDAPQVRGVQHHATTSEVHLRRLTLLAEKAHEQGLQVSIKGGRPKMEGIKQSKFLVGPLPFAEHALHPPMPGDMMKVSKGSKRSSTRGAAAATDLRVRQKASLTWRNRPRVGSYRVYAVHDDRPA